MILRLPIMVLIMGGMALLMLLPSIYGAILGEWRISRAFLHASIFVFFSAYAVTLIMTGRREPSPRRELSVLLLSWLLVPVFAAIPVSILSPALGPVGAWFDMVAAFTTTGGSAFGDPASVPNPVHLWRGLVAWMGGLVTLTAAFVILAPRRLGGFEVEPGGSTSYGSGGQIQQSVTLAAGTVPLDSRLYRALRVILPVYSGLTFCLALIFTSLGESGLDASVHAMSILSTSGISPNARGLAESDSFLVELTAALFMIFAASRLLYSGARQGGAFRRPDDDPELKLMLAMVALATLTLFSRHWIGALTIDLNEANLDAFDAFWGSVFTTLSFLTTTGFESSSWRTARDWSGLANPGLLLLGLCAVGGGAASTAGGIKLIRAYALVRHGMREVERIARPDSVMGVGSDMRGMMRQGAVIAWTFIMLFFIALLLTILGLTATGIAFDTALIAATAAVANTGPIFTSITPDRLGFADLSASAQIILALAMIAGRIEVLALIAIFNPDAWRRTGDATIKHW